MERRRGSARCRGRTPGVGKSTLAAGIGNTIDAPVFVKDVIEASLWRNGIGAEQGSWQAAEVLLTSLAFEQLVRGQHAVLDTVARLAASRATWRELADSYHTPFSLIECVCGDEGVHQSRLDGRVRGIPGWYEVEWSDVVNAKRRWEPWTEDRLVLDAIDPPDVNLLRALDFIRA